MRALRTRFGKDIVAEFLPPRRKSQNIIILCGGMPGIPSRGTIIDFFSKKGYWTFLPRYRGSWESGGKFLKISPHEDVLDVIDQLPRGFKDLWSGKMYKIRPRRLYLLGGSFGGPAVILASRDARVTKAVAVSPVVDWRAKSKAETLDWFGKFVREAFGEAYRFSMSDWNKLKHGKFYNPIAHIRSIDGKKLFLVHARDDEVVRWKPVHKFAVHTGAKFLLLPKGGHLSLSFLTKPRLYRRLMRFLKGK